MDFLALERIVKTISYHQLLEMFNNINNVSSPSPKMLEVLEVVKQELSKR